MKKLVIRFNAPVVLLFALLSLLVLLLDGWTGGVSTTRFFCVYRSSLADPLTYVRFFGHVLGHSGYSHYMNNMLLLLLVGPGLEEKYGSRNLLMTILATALVTGLVQFIFFPGTALLGASGVVFMMIVLNSFTEMRRGGIPLTMLLVVFTSIFFNRTRAGLSYKSVGEHPQAAATLGINVVGVKYLACVICGALAGMGGAYLTTCYSSTYTDGIVAGRGFIALAAVIFGRWSAGGILLACLFFGFCDALQIRLQVSGIAIPYQFFQMIPYVATVVVLSVIGTKQAGPKANGQPYRREQR